MANKTPLSKLTQYSPTSLKGLMHLSASLIVILFSGSLLGFCDRFFLSCYSLKALEACVSASSLIALFQAPSIVMASISQVVEKHPKDNTKIGKRVWQMIWWSFGSSLFILPLGFIGEPLYFRGSSIALLAHDYFYPLLLFNFLFPLGAALSSFHIGQGKIKHVLLITLGSHLLNILLSPLLIFGIPGIFPSLGILGAAIASIVTQIAYCAISFALFLQKKNQKTYGTADYSYDKTCFFELIKTGLPNALSRMKTVSTWAGITRFMFCKGGDYLLVLSIGSSIHLLFSFLNEGLSQGILPIASHLIDKNEKAQAQKLMRSSYLLLCLFLAFLSIPCLFFPETSACFFLKEPISYYQLQFLKDTCYWLWLYFFTYGFGKIAISFLMAAKDSRFLFILNMSTSWLTNYVFVRCVIDLFGCSPDKLWLTMAVSHLLLGMIYLWRIQQKKWLATYPILPN